MRNGGGGGMVEEEALRQDEEPEDRRGVGRRCKWEKQRTFLSPPECINTREGARCVRRVPRQNKT